MAASKKPHPLLDDSALSTVFSILSAGRSPVTPEPGAERLRAREGRVQLPDAWTAPWPYDDLSWQLLRAPRIGEVLGDELRVDAFGRSISQGGLLSRIEGASSMLDVYRVSYTPANSTEQRHEYLVTASSARKFLHDKYGVLPQALEDLMLAVGSRHDSILRLVLQMAGAAHIPETRLFEKAFGIDSVAAGITTSTEWHHPLERGLAAGALPQNVEDPEAGLFVLLRDVLRMAAASVQFGKSRPPVHYLPRDEMLVLWERPDTLRGEFKIIARMYWEGDSYDYHARQGGLVKLTNPTRAKTHLLIEKLLELQRRYDDEKLARTVVDRLRTKLLIGGVAELATDPAVVSVVESVMTIRRATVDILRHLETLHEKMRPLRNEMLSSCLKLRGITTHVGDLHARLSQVRHTILPSTANGLWRHLVIPPIVFDQEDHLTDSESAYVFSRGEFSTEGLTYKGAEGVVATPGGLKLSNHQLALEFDEHPQARLVVGRAAKLLVDEPGLVVQSLVALVDIYRERGGMSASVATPVEVSITDVLRRVRANRTTASHAEADVFQGRLDPNVYWDSLLRLVKSMNFVAKRPLRALDGSWVMEDMRVQSFFNVDAQILRKDIGENRTAVLVMNSKIFETMTGRLRGGTTQSPLYQYCNLEAMYSYRGVELNHCPAAQLVVEQHYRTQYKYTAKDAPYYETPPLEVSRWLSDFGIQNERKDNAIRTLYRTLDGLKEAGVVAEYFVYGPPAGLSTRIRIRSTPWYTLPKQLGAARSAASTAAKDPGVVEQSAEGDAQTANQSATVGPPQQGCLVGMDPGVDAPRPRRGRPSKVAAEPPPPVRRRGRPPKYRSTQ